MKWILGVMAALVFAGSAQAADWTKKGDEWERTETVVSTHDEAAVYNAKEEVKAWKATLDKVKTSGLTPADADRLAGIAHNLKQGQTIAVQCAAVDALLAEIPNVPKPVVVKDNLAEEPK